MSQTRKIAAQIAHNVMFGDAQLQETLDALERRLRPEHGTRRLLHSLATGTVQRAAALDSIIAAYSRIDFNRIEPNVLSALRVGTYELVFIGPEVPHVAIDAMVQFAGHGAAHARPFVKGVLYGIWKGAGAESRLGAPPRDANPRTLLQVAQQRWCRFDRDVFPDPVRQQAEYLAATCCAPLWMVSLLLRQLGNPARDVLACSLGAPAPTLIPNMARPDSSNLPDLLLRQGVSVHPAAEPPALAASEELDFENVPAYLHGRFIPMDVFDLCAVKRLRPRPGEAVCVLRGRPQVTALIAQMVSPGGTVSACARTLEEARALASEKERLGLDNLRVVALDPAQAPSILHASFDRVFVEPESTGIGKWRRDAARKWRLRPDSHPALVAAQKDALSAALELCAAGGIAMYLTATLLREENEAVVEEVTRRMHHLKVIEQKLQLPAPAGPDGGFIARIAKLNVA